ncbi:putative glycoside hydrolase [Virgibacillus sp. DJP39]|uniref:putative glycoside hydrolase n=1 Tax=Virgibacillus sp. DJP39 TaxID=3409790 RepID=UPI003BB76519
MPGNKLVFLLLIALSVSLGSCSNSQEITEEQHPTSTNHKYSYDKLSYQKELTKKTPVKKINDKEIRGIYLNRNSLKEKNLGSYLDLLKSTNLNAVVIDIKDDFGKLTYDSNIETANDIGSDNNPVIADMDEFLERLEKEDIYTIGRIVVFKDPFLAEQKNEYALKRENGSVWSDHGGVKWIDPYKKEAWRYITDIAKEVAASGIDEIQYDYIRFPENAKKVDKEITYDNKNNQSKSQLISSFLEYSKKSLQNYSVNVSADVFGLVTTAKDDMGIGQLWEQISPNVDYISPMTYPSHYAPFSYGISNPDEHPYDLLTEAMKDAKQRNEKLSENGKATATIRPWIQDFNYKSDYTESDIRNQLKALKVQGIHQYLLWNASNDYTDEAFD